MPQQAFEVFYITILPTGSVQVSEKDVFILNLSHVQVLYIIGSPVQFLYNLHVKSHLKSFSVNLYHTHLIVQWLNVLPRKRVGKSVMSK